MLLGPGHCAGVWAPQEVSYTTLTLSLIFMMFTVSGNLTVILAVLIDPHNELRSPFTLLIVNLAVTDLIVGALVEPLSVYIHYRESRGLTIGMAWLSQTAYFLCCTASLLSLAILTIDRFLAITKPVWYRANVSTRRVVVASVTIWVTSMALTSLFFVVGFLLYAFVFANLAILSTFLIFLFTYVRIFQLINSQIATINEMHGSSADELERAHRRSMVWEKKVTKTYLIVLAIFLACYVPSCLMIYLMNFCSSCSCELIHWFRDAQFILVTINSLINPFVYAIRLSNFRQAMLSIMRRCLRSGANRVAAERPIATINTAMHSVTGVEQRQAVN